MRERAAVEETFSKLLSAGLIFTDEDRLEIPEVLGTSLIAFTCRGLGIEVPQLDRGLKPRRERNVRKALLGTPCDGVWAHETRNPYGRMRFLQRQHPRVYEAKVEMLALEPKRPRRSPRLYDEIDAFLEILAVVRGIRIV